tara:strand:- start:93 stop:1040 length:948 start_codon:yes stop_codon:yes gene_type:complete
MSAPNSNLVRGTKVLYVPTQEHAIVLDVHLDDTPAYYTIGFGFGREKQTIASKLEAAEMFPEVPRQPTPMYQIGALVLNRGEVYSVTKFKKTTGIEPFYEVKLIDASRYENTGSREESLTSDVYCFYESELELALKDAETYLLRLAFPGLEALGYKCFRTDKRTGLLKLFPERECDNRTIVEMYEEKSYKMWKNFSKEIRDEFIARVVGDYEYLVPSELWAAKSWAAKLLVGWIEEYDEDDEVFYVNDYTGVTQRDLPKARAKRPVLEDLEEGWTIEQGDGREFYYNHATGESEYYAPLRTPVRRWCGHLRGSLN